MKISTSVNSFHHSFFSPSYPWERKQKKSNLAKRNSLFWKKYFYYRLLSGERETEITRN